MTSWCLERIHFKYTLPVHIRKNEVLIQMGSVHCECHWYSITHNGVLIKLSSSKVVCWHGGEDVTVNFHLVPVKIMLEVVVDLLCVPLDC